MEMNFTGSEQKSVLYCLAMKESEELQLTSPSLILPLYLYTSSNLTLQNLVSLLIYQPQKLFQFIHHFDSTNPSLVQALKDKIIYNKMKNNEAVSKIGVYPF